ncbi:hypothetical protein ACFSSC_05420 [Corynebacterium mendelii]|uniref:Transposase n=1 Tax=Corynebacterium mendelii TaxID=2765362 RepID=A0A939IW91_9CORY|nr:hypothetical protein [Corynebacterium mendelii]MBN9643160.1 hypothetical protein [Corynebacterium mendelii]
MTTPDDKETIRRLTAEIDDKDRRIAELTAEVERGRKIIAIMQQGHEKLLRLTEQIEGKTP